MKIAGKIKKGHAWLLALTFILSRMICSTVQAASGIEMDRVCSVSFVLDGDIEEEFAELKSLPVSVETVQSGRSGFFWGLYSFGGISGAGLGKSEQ